MKGDDAYFIYQRSFEWTLFDLERQRENLWLYLVVGRAAAYNNT